MTFAVKVCFRNKLFQSPFRFHRWTQFLKVKWTRPVQQNKIKVPHKVTQFLSTVHLTSGITRNCNKIHNEFGAVEQSLKKKELYRLMNVTNRDIERGHGKTLLKWWEITQSQTLTLGLALKVTHDLHFNHVDCICISLSAFRGFASPLYFFFGDILIETRPFVLNDGFQTMDCLWWGVG